MLKYIFKWLLILVAAFILWNLIYIFMSGHLLTTLSIFGGIVTFVVKFWRL